MQSNYGIVTKMGVWLMPDPGVLHAALAAGLERRRPRAAWSTRCATLMLDRTIENVPQILNTICLASVLSERAAVVRGRGPDPRRRSSTAMARELEIGRWMMRFALYGDEAVVDHRFAKIKEAFERIPGAEVWGDEVRARTRSPTLEHPAERVQGGVPNLDINTMTGVVRRRGGRAHRLLAGRAADRAATRVALRDLLRGLDRERGRPRLHRRRCIPINARSFIHVTMVIFDTKNEAQARARLRRAPGCSSARRRSTGYGEYRAHLDFMDLAAEQYSFNDHAYRRFTETIKDAVDPNGILSPGKQGIWPRTMREARAEA